ncbi:sensor histidine kinase [Endothiovibrio diazotrophicus]
MEPNDTLDFSSILASSIHDMKNSIGMVLNSLEEMIADEGGDACTPERAAQLQYEARRVNDNLISLLTLYKGGEGRLAVNVSEHNVHDFLEERMLHSKSMLEFRGITLEIDCEYDLEWYFDLELVAGVLNNALDNAVRYTKDKLRLAAEVEGDFLVIHLEDNGRGFPESMCVSGAPDGGGVNFNSGRTGLGLYFSSMVAEVHTNREHKGYIAQSNGGVLGGGVFSIYLP